MQKYKKVPHLFAYKVYRKERRKVSDKKTFLKIGLAVYMMIAMCGCATKNNSNPSQTSDVDTGELISFKCENSVSVKNGSELDLGPYCTYNGKKDSNSVSLDYEAVDTTKTGTSEVLVTATDKSGNVFVRKVKVKVLEPELTPTPKPSATPEQTAEATNNNSSNYNNNYNSSNNTTYNPPSQQITQPEQQTQPSYEEPAQDENTGNESTAKQWVPESSRYTTTESYPDIGSCQSAMLQHPNNSGCNYSNGQYVIQY